jgi:hypothetical protein
VLAKAPATSEVVATEDGVLISLGLVPYEDRLDYTLSLAAARASSLEAT